MKKKTFLIFIILIANNTFSQFNFDVYYRNVNNAIEEYNNTNYAGCIENLSKNHPSYFFDDDVALFNEACDSLFKKENKLNTKITKIKKHLITRNFFPTFLVTGNPIIDNGTFDETKILKNGKLMMEDGYFLGIIQIDRFLSNVRVNINESELSENSAKSLYRLAALNTLNIFRNIKNLPTRFQSLIWNDNLYLAILHNLKNLNKDEQEELLKYLWDNTLNGNIYLYQYAVFYDVYYQENNSDQGLLNYYGTACSAEVISYDPIKIRKKADDIYDIENVDTRRQLIGLCRLKDWYNLKKIEYDFNLNR